MGCSWKSEGNMRRTGPVTSINDAYTGAGALSVAGAGASTTSSATADTGPLSDNSLNAHTLTVMRIRAAASKG